MAKTVLKNRGPVTRKTRSGRTMYGYAIFEYENGIPVYQYTGIMQGNMMRLYPYRALVHGTKRDKWEVSVREIQRDF